MTLGVCLGCPHMEMEDYRWSRQNTIYLSIRYICLKECVELTQYHDWVNGGCIIERSDLCGYYDLFVPPVEEG